MGILVSITFLILAFTTGFLGGAFTAREGPFSPPKVSFVDVLRSKDDTIQSIRISFTGPVRRQNVVYKITPTAHGEWSFGNPLIQNHLMRELQFVPTTPLEKDTEYEVSLQVKGFIVPESSTHTFSFRTPSSPEEPQKEIVKEEAPPITLLSIPMDYQDDSLSCEAASAKMALTYKGHQLSETNIMERVGYVTKDSRNKDIWGDPHKGYVGDIDGKMCTTGFGVFWEPVAEALSSWEETEIIKQGEVRNITQAIDQGNPVIVWGRLPIDRLTDCSWETEDGKRITAYKETHVRLVIGYIGPTENPTHIILNDPLAGRLYWDAAYFRSNWNTFGRYGVIVR